MISTVFQSLNRAYRHSDQQHAALVLVLLWRSNPSIGLTAILTAASALVLVLASEVPIPQSGLPPF